MPSKLQEVLNKAMEREQEAVNIPVKTPKSAITATFCAFLMIMCFLSGACLVLPISEYLGYQRAGGDCQRLREVEAKQKEMWIADYLGHIENESINKAWLCKNWKNYPCK